MTALLTSITEVTPAVQTRILRLCYDEVMNTDPLMPTSLDDSPTQDPAPTPPPTPALRPSLVKHASLQPIHDDVVPEPLPPRPQPVAPQQPAPTPDANSAKTDPQPTPAQTIRPSTPEVASAPAPTQQPATESPAAVSEPAQPFVQQPTPTPAATPLPTAPPRPNVVPGSNTAVEEELTDYEKHQNKKVKVWIIVIGSMYILPGLAMIAYHLFGLALSLIAGSTLDTDTLPVSRSGAMYSNLARALPTILIGALYTSLGIQLIRHKEFGRKGILILSYISLALITIATIQYFVNPVALLIVFAWLGSSFIKYIVYVVVQVAILLALINFLQRKRVKALFTR